MALFKKQLAKVDEFEEMLKKAVGDHGRVKNVGKGTYDVSYKDAVFSILKNKDGSIRIMKFFCSKHECEKKFGLPYSVLKKEAEEMEFTDTKVPMYGKSIIMDVDLEQSRVNHRAVRNIMEQIITCNQMLKDRVAEFQSRLERAEESSE